MRGSLTCPPSTSYLQHPQGGLPNQVRDPRPRAHQALTGSNQRETPGGQGHYFFLLNKHWLHKWANDRGQKGKREATGSAGFNREGGQSLLKPPAPRTSCTSLLGVTEYAPGARPQIAQCTPKCVSRHTPLAPRAPATPPTATYWAPCCQAPRGLAECEDSGGTRKLQFSRTT